MFLNIRLLTVPWGSFVHQLVSEHAPELTKGSMSIPSCFLMPFEMESVEQVGNVDSIL